jgi:hypothetical protein
MGLKVPLRCSVRLHRRLFRPFSDGFRRGILRSWYARMPHSPARWPAYGRPEPSRLLKVNHYISHVRIKLRLGAYASSRQDSDYAGAGVVRSSWGRSITRSPAVLT